MQVIEGKQVRENYFRQKLTFFSQTQHVHTFSQVKFMQWSEY